MDRAQWQAFARQFPQLSHRQRLASGDLLRTSAPQVAAVTLIEQTAQAQLHCPACLSTHFHRHGHAHGLQRYRCVPCRKTFNALSGTPLAHLHHKERWLAYADCLLNSFSVRKAASQVSIHRNT
ncbi:IS1/IS1595 family N-terminal zinc-binding domain-containing protein, partial [Janthinobacterium psychrotolerans]